MAAIISVNREESRYGFAVELGREGISKTDVSVWAAFLIIGLRDMAAAVAVGRGISSTDATARCR
jgi:hypothetical protein